MSSFELTNPKQGNDEKHVFSKLYGVNATIIIFVFVLYIVR